MTHTLTPAEFASAAAARLSRTYGGAVEVTVSGATVTVSDPVLGGPVATLAVSHTTLLGSLDGQPHTSAPRGTAAEAAALLRRVFTA